MPRFIKMWLFSALISFTAIGMWKGLEWYYNEDVEDITPIVVSADELIFSYLQDEGAADDQYAGNYVLLTGVVSNMGGNDVNYTVNLEGTFYVIDLNFSNIAEITKLGDISNGDTITIIGLVDGLYATYIVITNCTLE